MQLLYSSYVRFAALALLVALAGCNNAERAVDKAGRDAESGTLPDGSIGRKELRRKLRWQSVLSLKDRKTQNTQVFKIASNDWKVRWKTRPGVKGVDEFIVILYDKANPSGSEIVANVTGEDEDFVNMEGRGTYYLSINTTQNYEIVIEEQK
jgi:hypothetical protein